MAKKNKTIVPVAKQPEKAMVIKASDIKVSIGHQSRSQGCGHHDNRPKRLRTRATKNRAALRDFA